MRFLNHIVTKEEEKIKDDLEESIFMTYVKVKHEL